MNHVERIRLWALALTIFVVAVIAINILVDDATLLKWADKVVEWVAVPATLVPICYTAFFPWWKAPLGRALFIKALSLLVVFDLTVTFQWWGEWLPVGHTSFDAYLFVGVGISYQLLVMLKIWWVSRKERAGERYRAYATYDESSLAKERVKRKERRDQQPAPESL